MRRMRLLLLGLCLWVVLPGCEGGAVTAFTVGLSEDLCVDNFFVCTSSAGCRLEAVGTGGGEYIHSSFPEARRLIVRTDGPAVMRVRILLTNLVSAGTETEIIWFEPGCTFRYTYNTMGADLFELTGDDQVFEQEKTVQQGGDHLIEFFSDSLADYHLKVEVEDL